MSGAKLPKAEAAALIRAAFAAREYAYVPYSRFAVGAALPALFKAASEGARQFDAIAIVGSKLGERNTLVTGPCGVCRQALYEFGGPALVVIMAKSEDDYIETTLGELLPYGFGPQNLDVDPNR